MANPVMNYTQFMAAFKRSEAGYRGKGDIKNDDVNKTAKIDQEMAEGPVKGKGTPQISKFTNKHLSSIKKKSASNGKAKG